MLNLTGSVRRRYKGTYTTRNGEVKNKIIYDIVDDVNNSYRLTDFNCSLEPYQMDEKISVPVRISTYVRDGRAFTNIVIDNDIRPQNLQAF